MSAAYSVAWSDKPTELTNDFLALPSLLYTKKDVHQNYAEEEQILAGTHPLSHYFSTEAVVIYDGAQPVGRALIVQYHDDTEQCFLGYYECIDDDDAAELLFNTIIDRVAVSKKVKKIIGPYNASFWLTYRLKIDMFNQKPYMTEPLSKSYYYNQFIENGFAQTHTYVSNEYGLTYNKKDAAQFSAAAHRAKSLHYDIKSPKPTEFIETLGQAYELFSALYTDFPGYKAISKNEFLASFKDLKHVLNYSFVKFAYSAGELAGFAVAFPDYGNLLSRPMTLGNKARIMLRRLRASRYVIIYLGVLPQHSGLAKALVRPLVISALLRGACIIGALALEDKVTASYAKSMIKKQYHYALFERSV